MNEHLLRTALEAMEADDRGGMLDAADAILSIDPVNAEGLYVAGMALFRMEKRGLATVLLNAVSQIKPDQPEIWNNLACAMQDWHPKDALHILEKLHRERPDFQPASSNLVGTLSQLGRWGHCDIQARAHLNKWPDDKDVTYNHALCLMQLGKWEEAWPKWRAGLGGKFRKERFSHLPRWNGEKDATLVIYGEQGIGDEILGAALMSQAGTLPDSVILECDERLEALFARSLPGVRVVGTRRVDEPDWIDALKPTHRLEGFGLGEALNVQPFRGKPFLKADPHLAAMARGWLDSLGEGLKVGIAWSGGVSDWDRAERTIPLDVLNPILTSEGCQFVCLEYLDGPRPEGVHECRPFTFKGVDFDLTAALISELDLVISVPQTCIDAAGALGTPCWTMVPTVPPWRFGEAAGDEAWIYEGVKLFRRKGQSWMPVTAKVARALREFTGAAKEAA